MSKEFDINQNTTNNQLNPSVSSLLNGNVFVAWNGDQTGTNGIYGRLFSFNGTPLSDEFPINDNDYISQSFPVIANLTNGDAFVSWWGSEAGNYNIYGQIFNFSNFTTTTGTSSTLSTTSTAGTTGSASTTSVSTTGMTTGNLPGNEFIVNQNTTADHVSPTAVSLNNDNIFAIWRGSQTGNYELYGRLITADGTALTDDFSINQNTTSGIGRPSITTLQNGNIFIAWGSTQPQNSNIRGRIFASNGTFLTDDFNINQNTLLIQDYPSVTSLINGNVFAAWEGDPDGIYNIYGRLFSINGTALNSDFLISLTNNTSTFQRNPSTTGLTGGDIFIAWQGSQSGNYDIYGRVLSTNGIPHGDIFNINQPAALDQYYPSVARLINGNIFVAWTGKQSGQWDVYGNIFSPNGTALGKELQINQNPTSNPQLPGVTSLNNGDIFVGWVGDQIYGQVLAADGTIQGNEFQINQNTGFDIYSPSAVNLTNGNIFVAWVGQQASDNIYGRIFNPNNIATTSTSSTTGESSAISPHSSNIGLILGLTFGGTVVLGGITGAVYCYHKQKNPEKIPLLQNDRELPAVSPSTSQSYEEENKPSVFSPYIFK